MRMHSYGKFSPNLIIGALLVFSVIVLYNYWSVSALNHDLTLKIHSLEQQIISISKTNDALQTNLEKVEEIRDRAEVNLQKEQLSEQQAKEDVSQKESMIKSLKNDLEIAKQETLNYKEENNAANTKLEKKDKEIANLKERLVSLQAQIVEKDNKIGRIEKDLDEYRKAQGKSSSSTAKSTSAKPAVGGGPVNKPGTIDEQPVLLQDPAEREMKPAEGVASPPGIASGKLNEQLAGGSAEVGLGVLPIPGQHAPQHPLAQQGNLDAQEDDGDRPLKDELIQQDDQSPDGDLPDKTRDTAGVVPAPALLKDQGNQRGNPGSGQQEEREAAHLRAPLGDNNFDTNNNL